MCSCVRSLFIRVGDEGETILCRALVAWRGCEFLIEGEMKVSSCVFLFLTQVGVYVCVCVCVCVCTHTHTHTAHVMLDVSPGVGTRHLEGPENADTINVGKHVFIYVYKVHMYIYIL